MLVLTRKLQQQIKIGDQITITVVRVKGNTVRLGVTAPRDLRVVRAELPRDAASASGSHPEAKAGEQDAEVSTTAEDKPEETAGGTNFAAPHLPQRRAFDRYGGAPLKQLVAQTVLAK